MAKKEISAELKEIREKVQDNKAIIGTSSVLKALRAGDDIRVFVASNCPSNILDDLTSVANANEKQIIKLDLSNEELGLFCRKNFFVSVLAL